MVGTLSQSRQVAAVAAFAVVCVNCAAMENDAKGPIAMRKTQQQQESPVVTPGFSRRTFARDEQEVILDWNVVNQSEKPWQGTIAFDVDGAALDEIDLDLAAGETESVRCELRPFMFQNGSYPVNATSTEEGSAGVERSVPVKITIAPWRSPVRYPMLSWPRLKETGWIDDMVDMGLNVVSFGSMEDLEKITALGAHGIIRLETFPYMISKKQWEEHRDSHPCPIGDDYLRKCADDARGLLEKYDNHPSVRDITLNTEMWGVICFCGQCRKLIQERFGLDPEELAAAIRKGGHRRHKRTLMIPEMKALLSKDICVDSRNSLLRFARWYWTEAGLNTGGQAFAETMHKLRPDIRTVTEPLMRFASLQRYRPPMVVGDWLWPGDSRDWIEKSTYIRSLAKSWNCPLVLTVTTIKLKGSFAPYYASSPRDLFLMENWLCLSAFPKGLQYTQIDSMMPPERQYRKSLHFVSVEECEELVAGLDWKAACAKINKLETRHFAWTPGLPETLKDFSTRVIEPFGPLLRKTAPRQAGVALLHAFTARLMSFQGFYQHFKWFPIAKRIINGPYAVDVVFEDQIERRDFNLNDYRVVILPAAYCLTDETVAELRGYIDQGGTILCDRKWGEHLPGAVVVEGLIVKDNESKLPAHGLSLWDMGAEEGGIRKETGKEPHGVGRILLAKLKPDYQCDSDDVLVREGELKDTRIVVVVNTKLEKGPVYGKYPNALEKSAPVKALVSIAEADKAVAYDLLNSEKLAIDAQDGYFRFGVSLPPAEGKIIAFYQQAIGEIRIECAENAGPGTAVEIEVELRDVEGDSFKGSVPLSFVLTDPSGTRSDFSHYDCMESGEWGFTWQAPVATSSNQKAVFGKWRVTVRELASGKTAERVIQVK